MKKARFPVYEIEHPGDEQDAIDALRKAGCTNIEVVKRHESSESIRIECLVPDSVNSLGELQDLCEGICIG